MFALPTVDMVREPSLPAFAAASHAPTHLFPVSGVPFVHVHVLAGGFVGVVTAAAGGFAAVVTAAAGGFVGVVTAAAGGFVLVIM